MRFRLAVACAAACLLAGCDHKAQPPSLGAAEPAFDPIAFFDGHIRSWGVVENRSGAPTGWVVTDCEGYTDGPDQLRMVQHLSFQHDQAQTRIWTLRRSGPQRYEATANDMIGSAIGEAAGRTFHWKWVLAKSPGSRPFSVTMEQWMFRLDDGSVMIRSTISKLGIIIAEVSEQFTPTPRSAEAASVGGAPLG